MTVFHLNNPSDPMDTMTTRFVDLCIQCTMLEGYTKQFVDDVL